MKTIITWVLFFISTTLYSQGQIISITVDPPSPTTADSVTVYVDLQFSSGSCFPDSQSHSTNGNNTSATSHHCLGMLTVICPYTDTFELGYLQAGVHQFDFILTSGGGPSPCTPGIVPDDQDSLSFTVSSGVGNKELTTNNAVKIYPNPVEDFMTLEIDAEWASSQTSLVITDAAGREVKRLENIYSNTLILENIEFPDGIYFFRLEQQNVILTTGKFIKG